MLHSMIERDPVAASMGKGFYCAQRVARGSSGMPNRWRWLAAIMAAASLSAGASALSVGGLLRGLRLHRQRRALSRENGMSRDAFLNRLG
jgi:hypothetical protein